MAYLFTPSQEKLASKIEGSLYYAYPQSVTVWLDSTGWHEGYTPDPDVLASATFVFTRPVVVSNDTADSLLASDVGGTLQKMKVNR